MADLVVAGAETFSEYSWRGDGIRASIKCARIVAYRLRYFNTIQKPDINP